MVLFYCTDGAGYHYVNTKNVVYDFNHEGMLDEIYKAFWTRVLVESGVSVTKAKKCAKYLYDRDSAFVKSFAKRYNMSLYDLFCTILVAYKEKKYDLFYILSISESMSDRDTEDMLDHFCFSEHLLLQLFRSSFKLSEFAKLALRCMYDILNHIHIATVPDAKLRYILKNNVNSYFFNFLGTEYVEIRLCDKEYKVKSSCILNKALMKMYTLFAMYGMSEQDFKDLGLISVPFSTAAFRKYRTNSLDSVSDVNAYAEWFENVADYEYGIKG